MNKKIISLMSSTLLITSCSTNINDSNVLQNLEQVNTASKKNSESFKAKFLEIKNIPAEIIDLTHKEAQKAADKSSKSRDIDYFDLHKNPVGVELSFGNEKAYILNYLGTSKNTEDLNIEFRSFYTNSQLGHNFNYSGPITLSKSAKTSNLEKGTLKLNKTGNIKFELITGMPPEYIVNNFENYLERELKPSLKMIYKAEANIASDDIFPYAVYANDEVKGFFFLISRSVLRLGDRKYADVQLGTFISTENEIISKLAVIAFNPKTKVGIAPKYEIKNLDDLTIVEIGDW